MAAAVSGETGQGLLFWRRDPRQVIFTQWVGEGLCRKQWGRKKEKGGVDDGGGVRGRRGREVEMGETGEGRGELERHSTGVRREQMMSRGR